MEGTDSPSSSLSSQTHTQGTTTPRVAIIAAARGAPRRRHTLVSSHHSGYHTHRVSSHSQKDFCHCEQFFLCIGPKLVVN